MSLTLGLQMNQALQNYFVDNDIQAKDLHVCKYVVIQNTFGGFHCVKMQCNGCIKIKERA